VLWHHGHATGARVGAIIVILIRGWRFVLHEAHSVHLLMLVMVAMDPVAKMLLLVAGGR